MPSSVLVAPSSLGSTVTNSPAVFWLLVGILMPVFYSTPLPGAAPDPCTPGLIHCSLCVLPGPKPPLTSAASPPWKSLFVLKEAPFPSSADGSVGAGALHGPGNQLSIFCGRNGDSSHLCCSSFPLFTQGTEQFGNSPWLCLVCFTPRLAGHRKEKFRIKKGLERDCASSGRREGFTWLCLVVVMDLW